MLTIGRQVLARQAKHGVSQQIRLAKLTTTSSIKAGSIFLTQQRNQPVDGKPHRSAFSNKVAAINLMARDVETQRRGYSSAASLPPHERVTLPNLSPTMETGTIVSWEKKEGDFVAEGEVLAMIETDKATMEMETPEEGYVAKILLPAGSKDVPVLKLICIMVRDKESIAAFKDFTGEAAPAAIPKAATPAPKVVAAIPKTAAAVPKAAAATPTATAAPKAATAVPKAPAPAASPKAPAPVAAPKAPAAAPKAAAAIPKVTIPAAAAIPKTATRAPKAAAPTAKAAATPKIAAAIPKPAAPATAASPAKAAIKQYPIHERVNLPNLSPTMETGTIVSWEKKEGDFVAEGEVLAMIETDKATMEMETPEEGYVAKILLPAGSKDVPVMKLICIMVSNKEDVAAFKDFTEVASAPAASAAIPKAQAPTPVLAPAPAASSTKAAAKQYPTHERVNLPNLSPTMETGTIVSWEKKEGDFVAEGEVLAMIETDKATMEMETPEEGYLAKILLPGGSKDVPVMNLICIMVPNKEDIAAFKDFVEQEQSVTLAPVTETKDLIIETPTQDPVIESPKEELVEEPVVEEPKEPPLGGRVFASPVARRMAMEQGMDIAKIFGTGHRGRVTRDDVRTAKPEPPSPPPLITPPTVVAVKPVAALSVKTHPKAEIPTAPHLRYTDREVTKMRKVIASRLVESKQAIPHYYLSTDVHMDQVLALRQQLNSSILWQTDGGKLSVGDFILKAAARSLLRVPECNSQWMSTHIRQFHGVDISVAVSTAGGLITPIVFDADKKGLSAISGDMKTLAQRARDGKLQPHEFQGGTFTVSNLGMMGVDNFSAVINPPQSCILAVGRTVQKLVPGEDEAVRLAHVMSVTMSCDHRVVDGAVGASWLKEFRACLENPMSLML